MKHLQTTLAILALAFFAISCENQSSPQHKEGASGHTLDTTEATTEALSLHNGKKWKVNEEMKPFIMESEKMLRDFIKKNAKDYSALAEKLKEKNTGLIKSCTMKGESHDELHKWLHPHMELIEELQKAENSEEAEAVIVKLNNSFETYNEYFK